MDINMSYDSRTCAVPDIASWTKPPPRHPPAARGYVGTRRRAILTRRALVRVRVLFRALVVNVLVDVVVVIVVVFDVVVVIVSDPCVQGKL